MAQKRRVSHQRGKTDNDHSQPFRKVKALRVETCFGAHDRPLDLRAPFNMNRHLPRLHQQARAVRAEEEVAVRKRTISLFERCFPYVCPEPVSVKRCIF